MISKKDVLLYAQDRVHTYIGAVNHDQPHKAIEWMLQDIETFENMLNDTWWKCFKRWLHESPGSFIRSDRKWIKSKPNGE